MKITRLLLLFPLLIGLPVSARGQIQTNTPATVEIELAQYVASLHVHANNQPYQWHALDHMVLYDIDGNPNAHAFVFAKADSRFKVSADLRRHVEAGASGSATNQLRQTQSSVSADNDLFAFDDLATVITGASTDSPLILRHFRGAPEFWIEAAKMEATGVAKQQAGRKAAPVVIMVTPMDFRLVSAEAQATPAAEPGKQAAAVPLAASAETIAMQSKKVERISALRQQKQERDNRSRQRFDSMSADQRKRHENALRQRSEALRSQWESNGAAWQSKRAAGEDKQ